ncbi:phosphoribosylformylglycinamidine synthase subunit PurQ [Candidatus Daviesbacteria bacterium]|nr:phosphoribosylformylglycinamidine synthase subunit PurQ [Candidatus Daviesbacteria bacterium]
MNKPKVLIFSGFGINSEEETKVGFDLAGGESDIVHINDLINKKFKINDYQILVFPGGFAYGDDTGAGLAYANKVKNHLWSDLEKFIKNKNLVIGICNGFQIIVNLGLLPALNFKYGKREVALLHNKTARYVCRWVDVKVTNNSPWLKDLDEIPIVISHGEGKFFADEKTLKEIKQKKLIALNYIKGEICNYQNLEYNPTGTLDDIAGITDESGRILGLMPHPERAMFFTQRPDWSLLKEKLKREGKKMPLYSPAIQIFKNAIDYFK